MSSTVLLWGLKIKLREEHTQDTGIGLYTSGGVSEFRFIESSLSGTAETWKSGMLADGGIPAIDEGGDFSRGGGFASVSDMIVQLCNTSKFFDDITDAGIGISGLRAEIWEFSKNVSTGAVTEKRLGVFQTVINEWDVASYRIRLEPAVWNRNAAMGTVINTEAYPYAADGDIGKMVPMTFGSKRLSRMEFTQKKLEPVIFDKLYPNDGELDNESIVRVDFKRSSNLEDARYIFMFDNISSDGAETGMSPQWQDILDNPTDYVIRCVYQGDTIELYTGEDGSPVTTGSVNIGKYRKISAAATEFILPAEKLVFSITLENEFEAPLGNSIESTTTVFDRPSDAFVEFNKIHVLSALDTWENYGIDDVIYKYSSTKKKYLPLIEDIISGSSNGNEIEYDYHGFLRDVNTIEYFTTRQLTYKMFSDGYTLRYAPSISAGSYLSFKPGPDGLFTTASVVSKGKTYNPSTGLISGTFAEGGIGAVFFNGVNSAGRSGVMFDLGKPSGYIYDYDTENTDAYMIMEMASFYDVIVIGSLMKDLQTVQVIGELQKTTADDWIFVRNTNERSSGKNDTFWFKTADSASYTLVSYFGVSAVGPRYTGYDIFEINQERFRESSERLVVILTHSQPLTNNYFMFERKQTPQLLLKNTAELDDIFIYTEGGRTFGDTWGGRKTSTDPMLNFVDIYEHICRCQSWGDFGDISSKYGKVYSPDAQINTGTGFGGFDFTRLDTIKNMLPAFQVLSYEESWTKNLKQKLLEAMDCVGYVNEDGEECIDYIPKLDTGIITDTVTLADVPGGMYPGSVIEPQAENIFCEPYLRFDWDEAAGKYNGFIGVNNVHISTGWIPEYTPGFSGSDGEYIWNWCHEKLWDRYHQIEKPPESLAENKFIFMYEDAKQKLVNWLNGMLLRRIEIPVYYDKARLWHVGRHIYIQFPHQTVNNQQEAVIERIVKDKSAGVCILYVAFWAENPLSYYYKDVMYKESEGADADFVDTMDAANPNYISQL